MGVFASSHRPPHKQHSSNNISGSSSDGVFATIARGDAAVFTCDGQWRYHDNCTRMLGISHGGLGNQILHALSLAVLAQHLRESTCSAGPARCDAYLIPFYMYEASDSLLKGLRKLTPGIDDAVAPCTLLSARSESAAAALRRRFPTNWSFSGVERSASMGQQDQLAALHRAVFERAWDGCRARVDGESWRRPLPRLSGSGPRLVARHHHYNYCGVSGLLRLREMPSSRFWAAMRRRARRLLRGAVSDRGGGGGASSGPHHGGEDGASAHSGATVDRTGTVCVHLRGRLVELNLLKGKPSQLGSAERSAALGRAARLVSLLQADTLYVATAFAPLLREEQLGPEVTALTRRRSNMKRLAITHSGLGKHGSEGSARWNASGSAAEVDSAARDLLALARCRAVVPEEAPRRSTFVLLAALMGGLRPCAALAQRVARTPQERAPGWHVLCRGGDAAFRAAWEAPTVTATTRARGAVEEHQAPLAEDDGPPEHGCAGMVEAQRIDARKRPRLEGDSTDL